MANRPLSSADAAVLQGALGPLSRRARLAFGSDAVEPVRRLTPREEEVLEHLALGKSVKQIASELRRSPHTVHDHVKSLHVKLHASSRGELIARALGHLKPPTRDRAEALTARAG
jgi:DNA-binding NarL/FixJ family response regulator